MHLFINEIVSIHFVNGLLNITQNCFNSQYFFIKKFVIYDFKSMTAFIFYGKMQKKLTDDRKKSWLTFPMLSLFKKETGNDKKNQKKAIAI